MVEQNGYGAGLARPLSLAELQAQINGLAESDLVDICLKDFGRTLTLRFSFAGLVGGDGNDVVVVLNSVFFLSMFRQYDGLNSYYCSTVTVDIVDDQPLLSSTVREKGVHLTEVMGTYWFRVEGLVAFDAIAQSIEVFREVALALPNLRVIDDVNVK